MEPEIARRCKACGASVRNRADFCPQCGAPLNPDGANLTATVESPDVQLSQTQQAIETQAPTTASTVVVGDAPPLSEAAPVVESSEVAASNTSAAAPLSVPADEKPAEDKAPADIEAGVAGDSVAASGTQTPRRHRVKVAARGAVEGKIAPRVEKLRQASTVVLDEAADDPGLRFVLVAAVLVILSLILLMLSHFLG